MEKPTYKKYRLAVTVVLMVVAFSMMTFILYAFSRDINSKQAQVSKERLNEVIVQNVTFVTIMIDDRTKFIEGLAGGLSETDDLTSEETIQYLSAACAGTDFERLAIDFANGQSYTSDGHIVDISDLGYLDDIALGKTFITDLIAAKIDGKPCISIIVPIQQNGRYVAAVRGTIYTQQFGRMLDVGFFNNEGYFHLLNSKGEYLALPASENAFLMEENYFDALQKLNFDAGYSAQQIEDDMRAMAAGSTAYSYEGMVRYAKYMPVGIADWYLMIITPKWVIDANAADIQAQVFWLVVKLLLISVFIFLFILYAIKNSSNEIKKINAQLSVEEKRYLFLLERTDNVIFEFDLKDGVIGYSEKFISMFGYQPTATGLPFSVIESQGVHPDDAKCLLGLFHDVKNGKPNTAAELRIRHASGKYIWCSIVAATIFSESGAPVRALGVIENIDTQKQRELTLIIKAEKDQLTGLYNKITTEQLITDFLNCPDHLEQCHALMIIDVDDFKTVNDKLGHLYGDIVLASLADALKPVFRDSDIIGRIGGDEFFVFLKNMPDYKIAQTKAKEICGLFQKTYTENNVSCSISASVGIALFPEHGQDMKTLYKNADSALYAAKANGKNVFAVYDGALTASYTSRRVDTHGSGVQKSFRENKIEYIFKLLYGAKDYTSAVHQVLQLFADFFGFTRSSIYVLDSAEKMFQNAFTWRTDDVLDLPDYANNVFPNQLGSIYDLLEKENLFVLRGADGIAEDAHTFFEQTGVKSLFLFGMRDGEKLVGFISFDDSANVRNLTTEEVDELITVCNVLSTFLLKQRALESAQNNYATISEIMNKMNYYGYVVAQENYELLFSNDKIRGVARGAKLGLPCYQTFMNRNTPCEICPLNGFAPEAMSNTVEINNHLYNIHSKTTASRINWMNGETAYLISSIDLSDFQQENPQP